MASSNDLFLLIKSLNKNEKGYFKKYTSVHIRGEKNNYLKLFEIIEGQKTYNENAIRKKAGKNMSITQFSLAKNYLYNLILKSSRAYNTNRTIERKIKNNILDIEYLLNKCLFKVAYKILKKTKKSAYTYEKFILLMELFVLEEKIIKEITSAKSLNQKVERIIAEQEDIANKLKTIRIYNSFSFKLYAYYYTKGLTRNKFELKRFEREFKNIKNSKEHNSSYTAKKIYFQSLGFYFYVKRDLLKSHEYELKLVKHIESHLEKMNDQVTYYVVELHNLLYEQRALNLNKNATHTLNKLKKLRYRADIKDNHRIWSNLIVSIYNNELGILIEKGQFNKGVTLIEEVDTEISKTQMIANAHVQIAFHNQFGYLCFGAEQYENTLYWINKIFSYKDRNLREDVQVAIRIMYLITHYELGHFQLLESILKSTSYYIKQKSRTYQLEKETIQFIKALISIENINKRTNTFRHFRKRLNLIFKDSYVQRVLPYFDLISWIESKIQNKPFVQIIKKKWN